MLDDAFHGRVKDLQFVTRKERVSDSRALAEAAEASTGQAEGSPADTVPISDNTAAYVEPCQQTDIGRMKLSSFELGTYRHGDHRIPCAT